MSGVLFDLGVSSPQLDRAERGFSYRHDAPLDMRMDRPRARTAADVVNGTDERDLAGVLRTFGDERFAGRIARAIVAARPVATTGELAELVRDAIPAPARRTGGHPAKRTFQAIRIAVNEELDMLPGAIDQAIDALAPGGRCAVLAVPLGRGPHREGPPPPRRHRRVAVPGRPAAPAAPAPRSASSSRRVEAPTPAEATANPRAASARLRAVEKLEEHSHAPRGPPRPPPSRRTARGAARRRRPAPRAPARPRAPPGPSTGAAPPPARPAGGPARRADEAAVDAVRRRARSTAAVFVVLAALAGAHTLIAQGQIRLDELDVKVRRAGALPAAAPGGGAAESPERVVAVAQAQGMVAPDDLVYLQPPTDRGRRARPTQTPPTDGPVGATDPRVARRRPP